MTKALRCEGQNVIVNISDETVKSIDQGGTYLWLSCNDWYIDTLDKVDFEDDVISTTTRWSYAAFDSECVHVIVDIADYMRHLYEIDYAEFLKNDIIKYKKALIELNGSL